MTLHQVKEHLEALERHEKRESKRLATINRIAQYDKREFNKAIRELDK
jgi:hypothetical protein